MGKGRERGEMVLKFGSVKWGLLLASAHALIHRFIYKLGTKKNSHC